MKIQNVSDAAFKKYGKVITGLDCSDIIAAMAETPCPDCGGRRLRKEVLAVTVGGMNAARLPKTSPTRSTAACLCRSATATAITIS